MNPFRAVLSALGWSSSPSHEHHRWIWLLLNYGANRFDANSQAVNAPGAPTVATGAAGALTGNYHYKVSFLVGELESAVGTESAQVSPSSQKVSLSAIPTGGNRVTGRKLYRTAAGGATGSEKFLATISDNTTTTYTDNAADGTLGGDPPSASVTADSTTSDDPFAEVLLRTKSWPGAAHTALSRLFQNR
jgi:hypothetical protein